MTCLAVTAFGAAVAQAQGTTPTLSVYSAGSLRAAMTDVSKAFEQSQAVQVTLSFGASGLLKDRIVAGESPQVFASANMAHPEALVVVGRAAAVVAFARNAMCVLATPTFALQGKSLAQRLLDADVRIGTSTPKADPAGDYAWRIFERIETSGAAGPGSAAALKAKALKLTDGLPPTASSSTPPSPRPDAASDRNVYGELLANGQADVFITYCTNASQARRERAELQVLAVPESINVSARYGLALLKPVSEPARAYLQFVLGPKGQEILAAHGFSAP